MQNRKVNLTLSREDVRYILTVLAWRVNKLFDRESYSILKHIEEQMRNWGRGTIE